MLGGVLVMVQISPTPLILNDGYEENLARLKRLSEVLAFAHATITESRRIVAQSKGVILKARALTRPIRQQMLR